jgi:hypothetical protein
MLTERCHRLAEAVRRDLRPQIVQLRGDRQDRHRSEPVAELTRAAWMSNLSVRCNSVPAAFTRMNALVAAPGPAIGSSTIGDCRGS